MHWRKASKETWTDKSAMKFSGWNQRSFPNWIAWVSSLEIFLLCVLWCCCSNHLKICEEPSLCLLARGCVCRWPRLRCICQPKFDLAQAWARVRPFGIRSIDKLSPWISVYLRNTPKGNLIPHEWNRLYSRDILLFFLTCRRFIPSMAYAGPGDV